MCKIYNFFYSKVTTLTVYYRKTLIKTSFSYLLYNLYNATVEVVVVVVVVVKEDIFLKE